MTKKDYITIARAISEAHRDLLVHAEGRNFLEVGVNEQTQNIKHSLDDIFDHAISVTIDRLNDQLCLDAPWFDRAKFKSACLK